MTLNVLVIGAGMGGLTAALALQKAGHQVEVIDRSWGTTAKFSDPDGNRCALRSQRDFGC